MYYIFFLPIYSKSKLKVCVLGGGSQRLSCLPNIYVSLATEPNVNWGGRVYVQLFLGAGGSVAVSG